MSLELWKTHPVLGAAGAELCRLLHQKYPVTELGPKESLAVAREAVETIDFLLSGALRVYQVAADGREVLSRIIEAPAVVGDAELFHGVGHLRNVDALEQCQVVRLPVEDFNRLLTVPELLRAEMSNLAGLCCVGARSELTALGSLEQRLSNVLLAYAKRYGRKLADGSIEIQQPLSLKMLARSVGGVWRSVGHVLSGLRKRGLIGKRDDLIVLLKVDDLETLAAPIIGGLNYSIGMNVRKRTRPKRKRTSAEVAIAGSASNNRQVMVEEEIVIGCEPQVDLFVSDPGVCPRHARVFRSPTGNRYWIQDLRSETGTRINGSPVRRALLHDGDRIEVGDTELVFRLTLEDAANPGSVSVSAISPAV